MAVTFIIEGCVLNVCLGWITGPFQIFPVIFTVVLGVLLIWIYSLKRKLYVKSENELFQRDDKLGAKLLQLVQNPVMVIDTEGKIVRINTSFRKLIGKRDEEILLKPFWEIISPEEERSERQQAFHSYLNDKVPYDLNETIITANQEVRTIVWKYSSLSDENDRLQYLIYSGIDFTEHLKRESELKISEEKFRKLFEKIPTGILFYEPIVNAKNELTDIRFIEANPAFHVQTGMKPDIIIGKTFNEVFPDSDFQFFEDHKWVMETGQSLGKERYVKQLGLYFRTQLFELLPGRMAIIYDNVTEVKNLEHKLIETVINTEERERKRIARDLHDEIGPQLASMNVYASSLIRKMENQEQKEILSILKDLIKDSITKVREISNNLVPGVIEKYGLVPAIKSEIDSMRLILPVTFEDSLSNQRFDPKIEISVYRIVKELLNNTKKYAQATEVDIELRYEPNLLTLKYSDNGIGFSFDENMKKMNKGMGLLNVESRAKAIKGKYTIWSQPAEGFKFSLAVAV